MTDPDKRLKVALLGCGQIADAHLQEIRKLPSLVTPVAVCDLHQDQADQAARRYQVPAAYNDLDTMLERERPDIVHVTTPAHTHAPLSVKLLQAGVHVYVEKPFAIDLPEAQTVVDAANATGQLLCLGHDQLFDPIWLDLKALVDTGEIGAVTHVESILGYPIGGNFGRQVTVDPNHWVRKLPGGLFQNTMQHPLYRITDYLLDEQPQIDAHWYRSEGRDFPTELTVMLRGKSVTANLLFATNIQAQRITRVYGKQGAYEFDPDGQTIRRIRQPAAPGAFGKIEMPFRQWREGAGNLRRNLMRFARSDIHYFGGMRGLFESFYRTVRDGGELPIAYDEMLRITRLMDEIFSQCAAREAAQDGQRLKVVSS